MGLLLCAGFGIFDVKVGCGNGTPPKILVLKVVEFLVGRRNDEVGQY